MQNNENSYTFELIEEITQSNNNLPSLYPAISIYGSARTPKHHPDYLFTEQLAHTLSNAGFSIISGGGPGIMEAANKGAFSGISPTVGLNIRLPHEQRANPYQNLSLYFQHFSSRKMAFNQHAIAFIVMPGGIGTLDELFESFTLIQTKKIPPRPIILVGQSFWQGLIDWIKKQLLNRQFIHLNDLDAIKIIDDQQEIVHTIANYYQQLQAQNP